MMTYLSDDDNDVDLGFVQVAGLRDRANKIINSNKGEFRDYPELGVEMISLKRGKARDYVIQQVVVLNLRMENISEHELKHNLTIR